MVNLRTIKDYIRSSGGLKNVDVSNAMLASAASARQRYESDLESKRKDSLLAEQKRKREATASEIEQLKNKMRLVEQELGEMNKESEKLYEKAEATGNVKFVASANSFRRASKEKTEKLTQFTSELKMKTQELKNI